MCSIHVNNHFVFNYGPLPKSFNASYGFKFIQPPSSLANCQLSTPPQPVLSTSIFFPEFILFSCPNVRQFLKLTGRSFSYIAHLLWNNLPPSMQQPSSKSSSQILSQPNSIKPQPLALSRSLFHSTLKTLLFSHSHSYHAPTYLHKPNCKAHPPE
jgi:hypothetical protein